MKNRTRNIMKGVGSIMDIMPARRHVDLFKSVPIMTPAEIMQKAWSRVGEDIDMAMRQVSNGTGIKKTRSRS